MNEATFTPSLCGGILGFAENSPGESANMRVVPTFLFFQSCETLLSMPKAAQALIQRAVKTKHAINWEYLLFIKSELSKCMDVFMASKLIYLCINWPAILIEPNIPISTIKHLTSSL